MILVELLLILAGLSIFNNLAPFDFVGQIFNFFGALFDIAWTTFDLIGLFLFLQRGVRDVGADPKLLALMQVHSGV